MNMILLSNYERTCSVLELSHIVAWSAQQLRGPKTNFTGVFQIITKTNDSELATPLYRKKVNRKVQGVPQSQTAAYTRHKEVEKNDKN